MTELLEDFKQYLPKYLSSEASRSLFAELRQFPHNIDARLYTTRWRSEATLFQGDGLDSLPVVDFPEEKVGAAKAMILSNTCDMDSANPRWLPARVVYCPIISLKNYEHLFTSRRARVPASHLDDVRGQRVSSMFYLPKNEGTGEDAIALLDRVNNSDLRVIAPAQVPSRRLFTLSDYGFYLLLYKLSIHFTRIREGVQRTA